MGRRRKSRSVFALVLLKSRRETASENWEEKRRVGERGAADPSRDELYKPLETSPLRYLLPSAELQFVFQLKYKSVLQGGRGFAFFFSIVSSCTASRINGGEKSISKSENNSSIHESHFRVIRGGCGGILLTAH